MRIRLPQWPSMSGLTLRLVPKLAVAIVMVLLSVQGVQAQVAIGRSECNCLNNGSGEVMGQFEDQIFISTAGSPTFTLVSAVGLFDPSSPNPPATLVEFPDNYVIPSTPTGNGTLYTLTGRRLAGTSWQVVISDGTSQTVINSSQTCMNPPTFILGEMGVCQSSAATYSIAAPNTRLQNVVWSISGGGTISGPTNLNSLDVNWGSTVGAYTVRVTGEYRSFETQATSLCPFDLTLEVNVLSSTATAMACNNLTNITMNGRCELTITADQILEGNILPISAYDIELRDLSTNALIPGGIIGSEFIGRTLQVKVIQKCTGNACWGFVRLEDKSIPPLVCPDDLTIDCDELTDPDLTGFPFDPADTDIVITPINNNSFLVSGFDNCTDVTLRYFDEVSSALCVGPFSSVINRIFVVTDNFGNSTSCTTTISVNRANLDDIVFPGAWDDVLGPNPTLDPCDDFPRLDNGHPSPDFTGRPMGVFCLNAEVTFTDTKLPICTDDNSFKIIRRWVVTDQCTFQQRTFNQAITVMDMTPPVVAAPNEFAVPTTANSCASRIDVPAPIIIFECSEWDYYVSYKLVDDSADPFNGATTQGVIRNPNGTYTITNIPAGQDTVWIVYVVQDACGNTTKAFTEADIIDREEPVPVCKEFTFVGLNDEGFGVAGVESFDNGSWDNCGVDSIDIRRMDDFACGVTSNWGPTVRFCCEDIGRRVMVQLRVFDFSGNSNTCMVEVRVQDNRPPRITSCPADVTVDCDANLANLGQFGNATFVDNCGGTITSTSREDFNECGEGTVTRTFIATDNFGNSSTCQQVITVLPSRRFFINSNNPNDPSDDIEWPGDHTITNGCLGTSVLPDQLPVGRRRPIARERSCSRIAIDYKDVVFQYTDDACFKILRTWTVLDWCQFNPFLPNAGKWTYTQVIKVKNSIAPTILTGCRANDLNVTTADDCRAQISATATGSDDCTPAANLIWRFEIDLDNNGSVDITGNGPSFTRVVNFGNHRVTFFVSDECGNSNTCTRVYEVRDVKKPTPICLSEIVTVIMPTTGSVAIWASDFNKGSIDNCTPTGQLRYAFSENPLDTGRVFTCADLAGQASQIFQIRMYVFDSRGNFDFCTANIRIQDNNNSCNTNGGGSGGNNPQGRVVLSGTVSDMGNTPIPGVDVTLGATLPEYPRLQTTAQTGTFQFNEVETGHDYTLMPTKTGDYFNGVTTLDLVLTQRHILAMAKFDTPYQLLAADVNGDRRITAADLVALRKLILGVHTELPGTNSWRFFDRSSFPEDMNLAFMAEEMMYMDQLIANKDQMDFVGIKMGDVNNSYTSGIKSNPEVSGRNALPLYYQNAYVSIGEEFEIKLKASQIQKMLGMQFTLKFDPSVADLVDIVSDELFVTEQNFGFQNSDKGLLSFSWNSAEAISVQDQDLFTLKFRAQGSFHTKDFLQMIDQITKPEAYIADGGMGLSIHGVTLESRASAQEGEGFELLQNVPNPFSDVTLIGFTLPMNGSATLKVFDTSGRAIFETRDEFKKGFNQIELHADKLGTTGILYYQLESNGHISSKKMIVIK